MSAASAAKAVAQKPVPDALYPFRMESQPRGKALELYAVNDGYAPVNLVIQLTRSKFTGFSPNVIGPSITHSVPPHSRKLITMAVPLKKGRPLDFAYVHKTSFGDSSAVVDGDHRYRLPVPDGTRAVLRQFSGLPFSTDFLTTENVVELLAPVGTAVVAARDGIVFMSYEASANRPANASLGDHALVLHKDGTWAIYGWLLSGSLLVKAGDQVAAGQPLAKFGPNPQSVDTFLLFGIARSSGGINVSTIPFVFESKAIPSIDSVLYTGPVSPDLPQKYPPSDPADPWHPSEELVPVPKVVHDFGDEGLSPAQRQALYRQRINEQVTAGQERVGDNNFLIFLAGAAVVLAFGALGVSLVGGGGSKPQRGWRGRVWSLLHGSQPNGQLNFDPKDAQPPAAAFGGSPIIAMPEPAVAGLAPDPAVGEPGVAESDLAKLPQRLHDPGTLELIRHVQHATPVGLLSSQKVPVRAFVPDTPESHVFDFVLIKATDASVVLVLIRAENTAVANHASAAGLPYEMLPTDPTADQVKEAVARHMP